MQRLVIVPEQLVDHVDVIRQQRFFVRHEGFGHFLDDFRNIDFHRVSFWGIGG